MASVASSSTTNSIFNRFTTTSSTSSSPRAARNHPAGAGGAVLNKPKNKMGLFRGLVQRRGRTQSVETLQSVPSSENLLAASSTVLVQQAPKQQQPSARLVEETTETTVEPTTTDESTNTTNTHLNLMQWLETDCPGDCLPHILAFCGPQQTAALSRTNQFWNTAIVRNEGTWRVMCEDLYKVRRIIVVYCVSCIVV